MPSPSPEIIQLVLFFATAFTAPTFAKALVLLYGAIWLLGGGQWWRPCELWGWPTASTLPTITAS